MTCVLMASIVYVTLIMTASTGEAHSVQPRHVVDSSKSLRRPNLQKLLTNVSKIFVSSSEVNKLRFRKFFVCVFDVFLSQLIGCRTFFRNFFVRFS